MGIFHKVIQVVEYQCPRLSATISHEQNKNYFDANLQKQIRK